MSTPNDTKNAPNTWLPDFPEDRYAPYERNPDRLAQLMQRIDESEQSVAQSNPPNTVNAAVPAVSAASNSWLDRVAEWFFGDAHLPVRAFAAASFVAALAFGMMLLVQQPGSSSYTLASGSEGVATIAEHQYIIGFEETATLGEINDLFDELGVIAVSGPDNQVLYTIGTAEALSAAQIIALETHPLVAFFGAMD